MKASETVVDAMNACKRSHSAAQVTQITHALAGQSTWRTIKKRVKQDERMSDSDKKEETGDAQDNACGRRRLTVKLLVSVRPRRRRTLLILITRKMVPVEEGPRWKEEGGPLCRKNW